MAESPVEIRGIQQVQSALAGLARLSQAATTRALMRIALVVHREAVKNAPVGPTAAQIQAARETARPVRRNPRATSRPAPGGLEKSIQFASDADEARIYVASNSPAGKYALRIHSLKGIAWRRRGLGTVAKGDRADAWFIARAIRDEKDNVLRIIRAEHDKAVRAATRGTPT